MSHSKGSRSRLKDALSAFFKPYKPDERIAAGLPADGEAQTLDTLNRASPEAFSILYGGHAYLKKNGTAALDVVIQSAKNLTVEKLYLDVGGQRFPALAWQSLKISGSYSGFHLFKLAAALASVPEGKLKQVSLVGLVGGLEKHSSQFDISGLIV
jgi:hypothetical protein